LKQFERNLQRVLRADFFRNTERQVASDWRLVFEYWFLLEECMYLKVCVTDEEIK